MFAPAPCAPDGRAPRLLRVTPRPAVPAAMPPAAPLPDRDMLAAAHRLAELYQMVFPQKKKWRKKRLRWQEEKLVADIQTFGNRVNRHHFPLYCDLLDADLDTGDWWLWQMPLELHGFCAEHHGQWDNYDEPIPLLLKLNEWENADEDDQAGLTRLLRLRLRLAPRLLPAPVRRCAGPDGLTTPVGRFARPGTHGAVGYGQSLAGLLD
jgi:hypothetical protein